MSQVRIGVIGLGSRGHMAGSWHQPQGRSVVVAGADLDPAKEDWFREAMGPDAAFCRDYRELLDRSDVDAVVVTSPDDCHEEHAVAALEAGKHVFCEKPLATTIEGCDHILSAWRTSGRRLMVGFNMRYMRIFRVMKEAVDSGVIGDVKAVWVRHFVGHGGNFYYHDWHGTRARTTGLLLQKGSHDIDMIHWITGRYGRRVVAMGGLDYFGGERPDGLTCPTCEDRHTCPEVQPDGHPRTMCAFRREIDVEDNNTVLIELEGGIKAAYLQCHFTPDYHRNYVFIGTEGRIENSEPDGKVWVKTRDTQKWRSLADRTYDVKPAPGTHGGADPVIASDFLDMVMEGKEPVATPLAGRMSVAVGVKATESLRNGSVPMDVPPPPPEFL